MTIKPFTPSYGFKTVVSPTASAQSVLVGEPQGGNDAFRFYNRGTDDVTILVTESTSTLAASATLGITLAAGATEVFGKDKSHARISYIGGTGGNTLHINPGNGS